MGTPGSFDIGGFRAETAPPEQVVREVTRDQFCFGFGGTLTGDITSSANWLTILAAKPGERWVLTGAEFLAVVTDTLAGSAGLLQLMDGTSGTIASPIGLYSATLAAGNTAAGWAGEAYRLLLGPEGLASRAANRGLFIGGSATLGADKDIYIAGWVRGRFVPGAP